MWTRFTLEGRELVPAQGPCILAPVHRSNMDTPFTAMVTRTVGMPPSRFFAEA